MLKIFMNAGVGLTALSAVSASTPQSAIDQWLLQSYAWANAQQSPEQQERNRESFDRFMKGDDSALTPPPTQRVEKPINLDLTPQFGERQNLQAGEQPRSTLELIKDTAVGDIVTAIEKGRRDAREIKSRPLPDTKAHHFDMP